MRFRFLHLTPASAFGRPSARRDRSAHNNAHTSNFFLPDRSYKRDDGSGILYYALIDLRIRLVLQVPVTDFASKYGTGPPKK